MHLGPLYGCSVNGQPPGQTPWDYHGKWYPVPRYLSTYLGTQARQVDIDLELCNRFERITLENITVQKNALQVVLSVASGDLRDKHYYVVV